MKCQWKGCDAEASCGIAINVPAKGVPIKEHDPLRLVVGLKLCSVHLHATNPEEFLSAGNDNMKKIFRVLAKGRADPDFSRAFISEVSFDSDEWKALTKPKT